MKTKDILEKLVYHMQLLAPKEYSNLSYLQGATHEQIDALEKTLGVTLPASLRDALAFYGASVFVSEDEDVVITYQEYAEQKEEYEEENWYFLNLPHYAEMELLNIEKIITTYNVLMKSGLVGKPHDNGIDGLENVVWHEKWIPIASNSGSLLESSLHRLTLLVLDEKSAYFGKVVDWSKRVRGGAFQYDTDKHNIGTKHITTFHHYIEDFYLKFHHNGMMYDPACYFIEDTSTSYIKKLRVRRILLDAIPT